MRTDGVTGEIGHFFILARREWRGLLSPTGPNNAGQVFPHDASETMFPIKIDITLLAAAGHTEQNCLPSK